MDELAHPSPGVRIAPLGGSAYSVSDIRSVLGVLLRHWMSIVALPLLAGAATYGILNFIPPLYKSTVEIVVVDPKRPTNAADDRRGSNFELDSATMESEIAILSSQSLALRVAGELGLDKDPEFLHSRTEIGLQRSGLPELLDRIGLGRWLGAPEAARSTTIPLGEASGGGVSPQLDAAASALRQKLSVERVQFSYVLAVSVTSLDPAMAQRLATAVANTYLGEQLEAQYDASKRATDWLTGRLEELRARVADSDAEIQKVKSANGLSDTGSGGNIGQQQLSDLNAQLNLARADVAERQARYDQVRRIIDRRGDLQTIPEVLSSSVIGQLRAQQAEIQRREADLVGRFGDQYPPLVTVRSQLAEIEKSINAEVNRILENLKNTLSVAQDRERSLAQSLDRLTGRNSTSQATVKLAELQRVADVDRKIYENFLSMFNNIQQRSTLVDSTARIITPASLPGSPAYPRRGVIMALVVAGSFAFAIGLAFLREFLDGGFRTSTQVEQAVDYPVLGMIPAERQPLFGRRRKRYAVVDGMIKAPASRLAEVVRSVRMSLDNSETESQSRIVLVTSSVPGEGKSTTSMLMAASWAMARKRVLLVDCDLRRKSTSIFLGLGESPGLAEVLAGQLGLAEAIHFDKKVGIAFIPAGSADANPADLLNSERMREVLTQLRDRYDHIVLDASPLLPVVDATVLSKLVDQILLIVEWRRTRRSSVLEAMKALAAESGLPLGVVLNKVNLRRLRSYGYGYGHGYNYGGYYRQLERYYHRP